MIISRYIMKIGRGLTYQSRVALGLLIIKDIQYHSTTIHLLPISVQNSFQNFIDLQEDKVYCIFDTLRD